MKKIKKVLSAFLSGITAVSVFTGIHTCYAGGTLYSQQFKKDTIDMYYIIGLESDPLACYNQSRENGVRDFVLTEDGKAVYETIMGEHKQVKNKIAELIGRTPEVNYDYTAAFNGFSMALSYNEKEIIKNNSGTLGITSIEIGGSVIQNTSKIATKKSSNSSSDSYADLTDKILNESGVTESGVDGDGIVIAVIDNEFDLKHEFLTMPDGAEGRLSMEDIEAVSPYLSAAPYVSDKCYVNEKIPFAFNYYQGNYQTSASVDCHGTHVAGIAAGNGDSETDLNYEPDGVASNAQLVLLSSQTFETSALMAAYDDVLYLDADVVNASYGLTYGMACDTYSENAAINNIVSTGTVFCKAAGNSAKATIDTDIFTDYSTSGTPTSMNGIFAVGSVENPVQKKENGFLTLADGSEEIYINSDCPIPEGYLNKEFEYVVVPGVGDYSDYETIDVRNKIALVKRGEIEFSEKTYAAAAAGAIGVIIYNNVDSDLVAISGASLPTGMVSLETGMKMEDAETKTVTFGGNNYVIEYNEDITMSDFSSWAFTEQLILSPDISGFGGDIVSSIAGGKTPHKSYDIYSGTSMASPQLTGINALLKEYLLNNKEKYGIVNRNDYTKISANLLMSTATPIYTSDNLEVASPRVQGNGNANLSNAIKTPCYISTDSEKDNFRPKLSLGDGYNQSYDLVFNVTNVSDADCTYTPSVQFFRDNEDEEGNLAWNTLRLSENKDFTAVFTDESGNKLEQITVPSGKTIKISAKVTMSNDVYKAVKEKNGRFVDGFVRLSSAENPNLTLSFMAFCGDWSQAEEGGIAYKFIYNDTSEESDAEAYLTDYSLNIAGMNMFDNSVTQPYFSPNGDDVLDSLGLYMLFRRRCYDLTITIYNSDGKQVYTEKMGSGHNYESYFYDIVGKNYDINWDFKENGEIKEGAEYTIEVSGRLPLADESTVIDKCTFKIDTQKPTVKKVGILDISGMEYLVIEAEDNAEVHGALISSDITGEIYDYQSTSYSVSGDKIIVDITESIPGDVVEIYDGAGNMTTVSKTDATYTLYGQVSDYFGYATTEEESFTDDKFTIVDEKGNEVNIDVDFDITPTEMYDAYGYEVNDFSLYIDGFDTMYAELAVGIRGDSNLDGEFNIRDAAHTARMLANKTTDEYAEFIYSLAGYCSDFDKNSEITVRDAAAMARQLSLAN